MKILFVIAALRNGGAERVLAALSSELAKDNEIHIAVLEKDCGFYEFSEKIAFHRLNFKGGGVCGTNETSSNAALRFLSGLNPPIFTSPASL